MDPSSKPTRTAQPAARERQAIRHAVLLSPALCLAACWTSRPPLATPAPVTPAVADADPVPSPTPPAATETPPPTDAANVVRRGALLLEGTPEVDPRVSARLAQYLDVRRADAVDISDDGKRLLVSTQFGSATQIHLVGSPLGARRQLTFGAEPIRWASFVSGDPGAVIYSADLGGNENNQLYRLDLNQGVATLLTDGKSKNQSVVSRRDGKAYAFSSTARNGVDFDLWLGDPSGKTAPTLVLETQGYWAPLDFSPDGLRLLATKYISATESELYLVDVAQKRATRLKAAEGKVSYGTAAFSRDGKRIFVTSSHEGEFTRLYVTDLAGAKWTLLSADIPWDVEQVAVSPMSNDVAVVVNEGGYGVLYLLDASGKKLKAAAGVPNKSIVSSLKFARKARRLALTLTGPTQLGDAYVYDLATKKVVRFTESEGGGLDESLFVAPELIKVPSFDKLEVPAFVYRPLLKGPYPVVISIHGGPESQARPWFSSFTQFLTKELGVAVVVPNVRGSDGYGKTYLSLDNGMLREDSVKDIGAILDWIAADPGMDPARVCVMGGSYGGYMTLASLIHFGARLRCGIDNVGISNFVTFLENTSEYRRDLRRVEYGDERDEAMRAHLAKISPTNNVDKIVSALFVAQGANDPRVPASEARQIVDAVRAAGRDVWYLLAENEGHGFSKRENRDAFLELTAAFFERHLFGR